MAYEEDEVIEFITGSGNVFADAGLLNADELQFKADLAVAIARMIDEAGISQVEAAARMEVKQPQVSLVVNGKLRSFSIDSMLGMAKRLGCDVHVSLEKSIKAVGEMHLAQAS